MLVMKCYKWYSRRGCCVTGDVLVVIEVIRLKVMLPVCLMPMVLPVVFCVDVRGDVGVVGVVGIHSVVFVVAGAVV